MVEIGCRPAWSCGQHELLQVFANSESRLMLNKLMLSLLIFTVVGLSTIIVPFSSQPPAVVLAKLGAHFTYDMGDLPVSVSIEGAEFCDDEVKSVAGIPSLERVSLDSTRVTRHGIEALRSLKKLESLDLSHTRLTGEARDAMVSLSTLKSLRLEGCDWLRDEHLSEFAALTNLYRLDLSATPITPVGLKFLSSIPSLRYLHLDRCPAINEETIDALCCLTQLMHLSLSGCEFTSRGYVELRQRLPATGLVLPLEYLSDLREVALRGKFRANTTTGEITSFEQSLNLEQLSDPLLPGHLALIGKCRELRRLTLHGKITDELFLELGPLPSLENLYLGDSLVTDDGLQRLAGFPNLKQLSMFPSRVIGTGLKHLEHTPQLTRLEIQTQQGDEVIQYLAHLPELSELILNAPITDEGLNQLPVLPKLRSLWLNGSRVRGSGVASLAKQPSLISLAINGGLIEDSARDHISSLTSLRWVSLRDSGMTEDGKARLREMRPDLTVQ